MKDGKFKDLIVAAYNKNQDGNLVGILYGAVSTYGFADIRDIDGFVNVGNPDMLFLKAVSSGTEASIYEWELENFKVEDDKRTIFVKIRNKPEIAFVY